MGRFLTFETLGAIASRSSAMRTSNSRRPPTCCVAWVLRSSQKTRKRKRNWPGRAWVLEDAKDSSSNDMSYEAALGMSHTNDGSCCSHGHCEFLGRSRTRQMV